ncbi:hypothetical protein [Hymenobacter sp. GOD-10R]|uniref:hypothetical protein n=1 Tax=Hymenobacter sp. GOD-10R TaxID=3093922 RepID=UPI002D77D76F|nr:hypothetical protein [Hymenobacter sp. GOD-10R]WRQ28325.1 hypothetical protein SD425_24970 [Hymenobacter sp. GOD-10R]
MLRFLRQQPSRVALAGVALLVQLGFISRAFGRLLAEPNQFLLRLTSETGDGMKNYFTFQSYLQQPFAKGLAWYGNMNYPYGDYVFYTDNTPLVAVGVKLFSHYVYDLTPYGLAVYHAVLLSGMLLSTVLLVAVLRRLLHSWVLILSFSVLLPWLNPQLGRLLIGHFNLSQSWVILLAIWGLLRIYERVNAGLPIWRPVLLLVAGLTAAAFMHLYYLPIVGLCTGSFFLFWLISTRWRQVRLVVVGAVITVIPLLLALCVIRATDGYYALRSSTASGFNYLPWKLQFSALFQRYSYERTHFIINTVQPVPYESQAYLGIFALAGLLLGLVLLVFNYAAWQRWWQAWRQTQQGKFLLLLLAAAAVGLFTALGTEYYLADNQYVITNYLSAFFYLHKITERVAQFRAVARFSWPFFWAINLLVLSGLDYWVATSQVRWRSVVAALFVVLAWLDTRDTLKFYRHALMSNVLTNPANDPATRALLTNVRPQEYQAILPIPYFHVGSEDLDVTIDDDFRHSNHAYQLSLQTGLPLMASKMSRTPPGQARALLHLFSSPSSSLRRSLRQKPILVFFDEAYYDGSRQVPVAKDRTLPQRVVKTGPSFIEQSHMTPIASEGKLHLYRWQVN